MGNGNVGAWSVLFIGVVESSLSHHPYRSMDGVKDFSYCFRGWSKKLHVYFVLNMYIMNGCTKLGCWDGDRQPSFQVEKYLPYEQLALCVK